MGAGLTKEQCIPGSEITNKISLFPCVTSHCKFPNDAELTDDFQQKFPWYDDLHAIWCENPSYNPIAITNVTMKSSTECVHDFQLLVSGGKGGDGSVGSSGGDED
jgi:hypothetical protein